MEEEPDMVKLLASLRACFASAVEAIDNYLKAVERAEACLKSDVMRGADVCWSLIQRQNEVVAVPSKDLDIAASSPAIQRFLVPKVLEALKRKYGVEYSVESGNGKLKAVRVKGKLEQREIDKLKRAIAWAFEKASKKLTP
ncbi:MAG: hypothetical protein QXO20_04565 [Candidatus Bathyarchaeia archaeon]